MAGDKPVSPKAETGFVLDLVSSGMMSRQERKAKARAAKTAEAEAALGEIERGFRERRKTEAKRFEDATDSEFWFAVCFDSREQKEAFLKALQWTLAADGADKYLDGVALARKLGLQLPASPRRSLPENPGKSFEGMTLDL